jgi:hypothetical protein
MIRNSMPSHMTDPQIRPTKTGEREKIAVWLEYDQLKASNSLSLHHT